MMEWLEENWVVFDEFILRWGWYIAAFLMGVISCMVVWMIKRPEDFFKIDDDAEDTAEGR